MSQNPESRLVTETKKAMVGPARLERATLCLEGRCSIHLSYGPMKSILAVCSPENTRSKIGRCRYGELALFGLK